MSYIDLHTHSSISDGTMTPRELVNHAHRCGLRAIALTDHDTTAGLKEAREAQVQLNHEIQVIPGVELSTAFGKEDIHILGLCIQEDHPAFQQISQTLIQRRNQRNQQMVDNLQQISIPITMEDLTLGGTSTSITRAHFARHLIELGIVSTSKEAFEKYLGAHTPYYVPREYITPEEGISLIHQAGGVAILAHPVHYQLTEKELVQLIARLKEAGLDGLELLYSNHSHQDTNFIGQLCLKYQLIPSGGSDFHGSNKPDIALGIGRGNLKIPYSYLEKICATCNYPLPSSTI